ncbi:hypothetical protein EV715DRAFT_264866 [Schizophyllum commune]
MVDLWTKALEEYSKVARVDFSVSGSLLCQSKADLDALVNREKLKFQDFRVDGPKWLRDRLPLFIAVVAQICDPIGDALSDATIAAHEEFEATCKAFDEIEQRIRITSVLVKAGALVVHVFTTIEKLRNAGHFQAVDIDKIQEWLNPKRIHSKISKLLSDRDTSTGTWFLKGTGCGKSTLISQEQNLDSLLSSILGQLAILNRHSAVLLSESRSIAIKRGHTSTEEKCALLCKVLSSLDVPTFILVDALDEADQLDKVTGLLKTICDVPTVSLLVSGRIQTNIGSTVLNTVVQCMVDDTDHDIKLLLDRALAEGSVLSMHKEYVHTKIRNTVLSGAKGNFRWAALFIEDLQKHPKVAGDIVRRLESIPTSLEQLYDDRLRRITNKVEQDQFRRLLCWLMHSGRPVSLQDFAHLSSFEYPKGNPTYNPDLLPVLPNDAIDSVVDSTFISATGDVVHIAHASVQRYLTDLARLARRRYTKPSGQATAKLSPSSLGKGPI